MIIPSDEELIARWKALDDGCECDTCVVTRALADRLASITQPGAWSEDQVEKATLAIRPMTRSVLTMDEARDVARAALNSITMRGK